MSSHLLVERALSLVPETEEFLPLREALLETSRPDPSKRWASSGAFATLGKRVADPARLGELIPSILEQQQRRQGELFTLVVRAIAEEQEGNPAASAETLIRAGEIEEGARRLREAELIYRLALEIAANLREKRPQILALRRLARAARSAGRLDEAWSLYEQSFRLSQDEMDLEGQVIASQGLGNVCDDRGQWDQSRAWYERGLRLARGLDRPDLVWPFYSNLAISALHAGDLREAETHLATAREAIERSGNAGAMLFWWNNRGLILLETEDGPGAEAVYREALATAPAPGWEMVLRLNLGRALVLQDHLLEAEEEARRAEEIAIVERMIPSLVDVYDVLGAVARVRRDEEGFVFFEQALNVCRERGLPEVRQAYVYRGYARHQVACGRLEEARAYLERALATYRELGLTAEAAKAEAERARLGVSVLTPG